MLTAPFKVGLDDTWIQIKTGEYMLQQGIPRVDPFSYTAGDRPYTEHEWLSCILFYLFYAYGGAGGLVLLLTSVVSTAYLLAVTTARSLVASYGVIVLTFG